MDVARRRLRHQQLCHPHAVVRLAGPAPTPANSSCIDDVTSDPNFIIYPSVRTWAVSGGSGAITLYNATAPVPDAQCLALVNVGIVLIVIKVRIINCLPRLAVNSGPAQDINCKVRYGRRGHPVVPRPGADVCAYLHTGLLLTRWVITYTLGYYTGSWPACRQLSDPVSGPTGHLRRGRGGGHCIV